MVPGAFFSLSCVISYSVMNKQKNANWRLGRLFSFLLRVLRGFKRNQGLLLSSAVAYHTLLSIVPMSILALIVLVWYYSVLSLVNLIYGSIATVVVALLSVEAVALILLLGAQVIAELERKTDEFTEEKLSGFGT